MVTPNEYNSCLITVLSSELSVIGIVTHVIDLICILFLIFCTLYTHVSLLCNIFDLININVVVVVVGKSENDFFKV